MDKKLLLLTLVIWTGCSLFANADENNKSDYYFIVSPLSFHVADSEGRKATGCGFDVKGGFEFTNKSNSRTHLVFGAELAASTYSFNTYKHFSYKDVVVLGKAGYEFPLNEDCSASTCLKGGIFIGFLNGKTDCCGSFGGDISFDYKLGTSSKLIFSGSVLYVFQHNAHSVLFSAGVGLKFALSGRGAK